MVKFITCTSCERELPSATFPKAAKELECEHPRQTCRWCWRQWLNSQVNNKRFDQIPCAECAITLGQHNIRALATADVYQKYLNSELKATLSADPEYRHCLSPTCSSGQIHGDGNIFRCVTCGFKACTQCDVAWHEDETCEHYQRRTNSQPKDEEESAKALKLHAKLCPGCSRKVQKRSGCDHMICTMCRFEFCWRCLVSYVLIRRSGNSAHKRDCRHFRADPTPRQMAV